MNLFGIGPFELFLILVIALIVLGPRDMVKAGQSLGRLLRRLVTSPEWRSFQQATREIRHLPENLMREAGLENPQEFVNQIAKEAGMDQLQKDLNENITKMQQEVTAQLTLPAITPPAPSAETIAPPPTEVKP